MTEAQYWRAFAYLLAAVIFVMFFGFRFLLTRQDRWINQHEAELEEARRLLGKRAD